MNKLLLIGMDGATLDLIEPWARDGYLPNLSKIMQNGVYGRLQSVLPVLSSAAWPSFMTGMNPGKHGLFDFVKRAEGSYQLKPVNRTHLQQPTLWGILSEQGRRVGVINVPMTYPPEQVNGFMVTGLGTPDYKTYTFPAELSKTLNERGFYVSRKSVLSEGDEEKYLAETKLMADNLLDATQFLMNREQWEFLMVVFYDTDQLGHYFWHFMDENHPRHQSDSKFKNTIRDYYQQVDTAIGKLIETSGPDTNVMIMSDHGMGPLYKDVFLNEWLRRQGWLVLSERQSKPGYLRTLLAKIGLNRENISTVMRKAGLKRLEFLIKDILGERINLLSKASHTKYPDVIDWSKTKAYSFGFHGQIYVNLRGREPQGIVEPGEEYKYVCDKISQELMGLVDPEDNKPIVDRVYPRDEAFFGEGLQNAPDLVVIMRELAYITRTGYEFGLNAGDIIANPEQGQMGSHRMDGVWMMAGPDVRKAGNIGTETVITDLAPTILHMLGCSIPEKMDGMAQVTWLKTNQPVNMAASSPVSSSGILANEDISEEDEAKLMQRLKDLGYLE